MVQEVVGKILIMKRGKFKRFKKHFKRAFKRKGKPVYVKVSRGGIRL